MTVLDKLSSLRREMKAQHVDAVIILSGDPHQNEYLPSRYKTIEWFSGFSGSAGTLVITQDFAGLWTDSRYFLQAETQLTGSTIELQKLEVQGAPEFLDWIVKHIKQGGVVSVDGNTISINMLNVFQQVFTKNDIKLVINIDLIDALWIDRPSLPSAPIFEHDVKFAGQSRKDKINGIRSEMVAAKVEFMLITALDEIAWLLNLRGSDINCNPVFLAYVLLSPDGLTLFVDESKLDADLKKNLAQDDIRLEGYENISQAMSSFPMTQKILVSGTSISANLAHKIPSESLNIGSSPVMIAKSIKSGVEQEHIRNVMVKDGVAILKAFMWLESILEAGQTTTEYEVALKLGECRREQSNYVGESFDAIVGYNSNGAIIHYKPEENSSATIRNEGVLLVDSGGQYLDGTTDITRTIALSTPTEEVKTNYTLVLKGHIDLAKCKFPKGTKGIQLDILARQFLWAHGLNYAHGTGHGVGFFLNVHEPPQGIAGALTERGITPIQAGTLTSNEPGYYSQGKYGIRIENLVLCRVDPEYGQNGFLSFETVTLFPFDLEMIDIKLLSLSEIAWINDYHAHVYNMISPKLNEVEAAWLSQKCRPIH